MSVNSATTAASTALRSPSYFRITLIRSAIGLPSKSIKVLKALGLRKRMSTVFHVVSPSVVGQIMQVKELIAVSEVDRPLTKSDVRAERKPDTGFYVERQGGVPGSILEQLGRVGGGEGMMGVEGAKA